MRCPRCSFENMPGLSSCVRCGSVLVATRRIDVRPPRAGMLKPLHKLRYRINAFFNYRLPATVESLLLRVLPEGASAERGVGPVVLSIIPGLGHCLQRRFLQAAGGCLGWLSCLAAGIYWLDSPAGPYLFGGALAMHAVVVGDAWVFELKQLSAFDRVRATMIAFLALLVFPYGTTWYLSDHALMRVEIPVAMPEDRLEAHDHVLVSRYSYLWSSPRRGELVAYSLPQVSVPYYYHAYAIRGNVLGKVYALAGDMVELSPSTLTVTERTGRRHVHHTPPLAAQVGSATFSIPGGIVWCLPVEARLQGAPQLRQQVLLSATQVPEQAILGRAFVLYNPPERRRWLPRTPP